MKPAFRGNFFENPQVVVSVRQIISGIFLLLIGLYQKCLSGLLPDSCRFFPTCSEYAFGTIKKYGPMKGTFLAVKRILSCHPFHPGGIDPVP